MIHNTLRGEANVKKLRRIFKSPAASDLYRWSKCAHGAIAAICLIGVVNSLLSLAVTLVTKNLVDGAVAANADALWRYGAMLAGIMLAERVLNVANASISIRANARLQSELQGMVTRELMGKDYAAIKPFHSGELVNRIFSDVSVVKGGILGVLPSLLRTAVSFVGAAIILIGMDWRFVPVLIIASVAGAGFALLFREPMKRRHRNMQQAEDALHAATQETLENIRVVKASGSEERMLTQMDMSRDKLLSQQVKNGRLSMAMRQGMSSVFSVSWLICNLWGCVKIYQGTFTYGSLTALISLVGRIQSPIANAVNLLSQIYGVVASAERLQDVVNLPPEAQGEALTGFDEIRLDNVCFQYDDGLDDVLTDLNATIHRGDFVALTGISGGGKTSLFQLLLGIYQPTAGQVSFVTNGRSVPASRGTRGLFSYVPQGNTLFSGTLKDNLTMFTDHATDEAIAQAIQDACLTELVDDIGLNAVLGERGVGLSEGQAQRVAVARALLSNAPIVLLDESTSALDERTEAKLLENLSAMRSKTVIIVTHRRAALKICDYALHIENGRMTSQATGGIDQL